LGIRVSRQALSRFHDATQRWFLSTLGKPTRAQELGWAAVQKGASTLLLAPTGSGKTLAAFLTAIDELAWSDEPERKRRCRVLYVSPLKALAVDVERNLRAPMNGVVHLAQANGEKVRTPSVLIRTGDTPQHDRARMRSTPPDILITTPESLYLLLTSTARDILTSVETVIVDEIHQMVASKRGAHLFLSLERLERLRRQATPSAKPLQRIGLSATQRPLDEVARLLGGLEDGKPRPVEIVDVGETKQLELRVEVPDIDMARLGEPTDEIAIGPAAGEGPKRTIWPEVHQRLVELVRAHRSTMVFVNSRRLAERLAAAINEAAGEELALAHHGSVAKEKRAEIEDRLKRGDLPAIVATSSLELGIDMGAVDLVVQIEAPPSVASGLQRVGRASHDVGGTPSGILMPKHRADLLATAAAVARMRAGDVEEMRYPRNPLDVLAQQIVAAVAMEAMSVDELFALVRRAAPFADLPRASFEGVLDMLSGRYPSDGFSDLRPRVTWDRTRGLVSARRGAQRLAVLNGGTIPDRGLYGVFLAGEGKGSKRVGELDEEMVFEMREGDVFLLGATSWRADEITRDRVIVTPAGGKPGRMPFWHGDRAGRSAAFGAAVGRLAREIATKEPTAAMAMLTRQHHLDASAARNLVEYVAEQIAAAHDVPSDKTIVVERFLDELGDWRVCVMTPFGARVHAPWATAVLASLRARHAGEVEAVWSDDGMVFRVPAVDEPPALETFFPPSEDVERVVTEQLAHTALFAARFRENAARALLLPRKQPGKRTPLWMQRKRAADLLAVASQYPSFPIILETYRECLRDVFDMPALVDLLRKVETRKMRAVPVESERPSPFAMSLTFSFVGNFIYDGDAPLAERRVRALSIDHAQLRELLGEAELRQLLDPDVLEEHTRALQRLGEPLRSADALHDLLLWLGDLSAAELRKRGERKQIDAFLEELSARRRIAEIRVAGEPRFIASEDAARYRDGLGAALPRGLPAALLAPVADPLGDLVGRYARTHGPFTLDQVAARFGLGRASVEEVAARLVASGRLLEGAFLPRGRGLELCDRDVLRALRRKSLAKLREEIEPVDAATYARFLADWQGARGAKRRGADALLSVIGQLQGAPLPASDLERSVLPARIEGYRSWELDALCAAGEVVWAGVEPLGPSDGRIALYLADQEALLSPPPRVVEGPTHARIRDVLARRGAVFFADVMREIGGYPQDALDALWDMVFAGEVTNDTLEPLRSLLVARGANRARPKVEPVRGRMWRAGPPGSEGRWSLRSARWVTTPTETERRTALARALLDRHGVVTREAVHAEGIEGGFSAVYDVLKAMEEAGRVRRGYFVAERGATQFALPGADDRLRGQRAAEDPEEAWVLCAADPANPYGAALPWPERDGVRPQRAAGARVVLHAGALVGWLGRAEDSLLTFLPEHEPARTHAARALGRALASLVQSGARRALSIATIDGAPAREHPIADALVLAGFTARGDGSLQRRSDRAREDEVEGLADAGG
jgi:ATP-dependent Lhr-like helicase